MSKTGLCVKCDLPHDLDFMGACANCRSSVREDTAMWVICIADIVYVVLFSLLAKFMNDSHPVNVVLGFLYTLLYNGLLYIALVVLHGVLEFLRYIFKAYVWRIPGYWLSSLLYHPQQVEVKSLTGAEYDNLLTEQRLKEMEQK